MVSGRYATGLSVCLNGTTGNNMSCITPVTKVKKVHPNAHLPIYASVGAAAADVTCVAWKAVDGSWQTSAVIINPGKSIVLDTGLQFAVPPRHELKVHSRSGHGFKHGIRLANCTGIIDSDYRGNLMVKLHNDSDTAFRIEMGERVVQVQVCKAPQNGFIEVDELDETERGEGGFGSTGTKTIGGAYDHTLRSVGDGVHVHTFTK